jgi:hypothetical protein
VLNFNINRTSFSELFWNNIFNNGATIIEQAKKNIISKHLEIEQLRKSADYNTGSISIAASVGLSLLINYFRPHVVAEVGTFIGRSTYSIALGHSLNGIKSPQIHTCDFSNDIRVDFDAILENVIQYPKKSSTEMLESIVNQNISPDIYLLDGRIQDDDISLLLKLQAENSLFFLDDFEGTEKGVSNAFTLLNVFKNKFILAYPPSNSFLRSHGFSDSSSTAVLIPLSKIAFVNQG